MSKGSGTERVRFLPETSIYNKFIISVKGKKSLATSCVEFIVYTSRMFRMKLPKVTGE